MPSAVAVAAALGLAVLTPGAAAQDPAAMLEAMPQVPANPPETVISERYRDIETVVTEALPAAPPAEPAAPPPAPPEPPKAPKPEYQPEYHSEPAPEVTVTQANPQNVNVSIRINSPGDDGPVTQINNNGGSVAVPKAEPAQPKAAAPQPSAADAPAGMGGPESWEWIWTSACFGGSGGGAPVATASANWVWRWSCGEPSLPASAEGVGEIVDELEAILPGAEPALPSLPALAGELASPLAGTEQKPARRARPESRRSGEGAVPAAHQRPPPPPAAAHGGLLTTGASPPATHAAVDAAPPARPRAQARPRGDVGTSTPSGDGGLAAGPATGSGGGTSLLLAGWIAVLASALGLVLPRLWLRRWSGPAWRIPWPRSTRLERPG